jgi:hypothetical protein
LEKVLLGGAANAYRSVVALAVSLFSLVARRRVCHATRYATPRDMATWQGGVACVTRSWRGGGGIERIPEAKGISSVGKPDQFGVPGG